MIEEIVRHDEVTMRVPDHVARSVPEVHLLAAVIDRLHLLGGKENRVIIHLGTQGPRLRVVIPFLDKEHAGLRAGVGLERVWVESHDSKDATLLHDKAPYTLVARIVEPTLRQNNCHPPARLQEI